MPARATAHATSTHDRCSTVSPPIPVNEQTRLEELESFGILDSRSEPACDDLTFLASQICDAPIALISLVDADRQWIKSAIGLDTKQTDRSHTFCAHAIIEPGRVMVVTDATRDDRFADNPLLLADPSIRFYAGAPLVTSTGAAIGTLCVIDRVPRDLTSGQLEALQTLSRQVMAHLELRRLAAGLEHEVKERRQHAGRLERELKRVSYLSRTDPLTGLRNRRAFLEAIEAELNRTSRSGLPTSLVLLDVDHFKPFNDEFGHPAGDNALQQVARILTNNSRSSDTVARYGGEEFGIVLPATSLEGAEILAERLRRAVEEGPWKQRPITASFGLATGPDAATTDDLVRVADEALYVAKRAGRNRVAAAA
jgi:diguanylate cyclase (GGDEF)-like protein